MPSKSLSYILYSYSAIRSLITVTQNNRLLNIIKTTDDTKFSNDIKKVFQDQDCSSPACGWGLNCFFLLKKLNC